MARSIYFSEYWLGGRCDRLPPRLDLAVFDAAVLHGPKAAIVLLQQSLRVDADGIYGDITNTAAWTAWREEPHARTLIRDMLSRRALLMHDLAVADSSQAQFYRGWMLRLFALHAEIIK